MERNELPVGFGIALAKNAEAMQRFANLTDGEKQEIIDGTHAIESKREMERYVDSIRGRE